MKVKLAHRLSEKMENGICFFAIDMGWIFVRSGEEVMPLVMRIRMIFSIGLEMIHKLE